MPDRLCSGLAALGTEERCSGLRRWECAGVPTPKVFIARKEDVIGILLLSQPTDDAPNGALRHNRASCRRAVRPSSDVKENGAAGTGLGRIGVVTNFNEPAMRWIVKTHLLLLKPRGRISWIDDHVLVVVRQRGVINPRIGLRDCVKRIFGPLGDGSGVGVNFSNLESARRRALIAFGFLQTGFVGAEHTSSPG